MRQTIYDRMQALLAYWVAVAIGITISMAGATAFFWLLGLAPFRFWRGLF